MTRRVAKPVLLILIISSVVSTSNGQGGKRETRPIEGSTSVPRPKKRRIVKPAKEVSKLPVLASLTVTVNPPDTGLYLNGQHVEGPTISGLEPGNYLLTLRRDGYQEEVRSISLAAGENSLAVKLEPLKGTLNLLPNIGDAEIVVESMRGDEGNPVQRYIGLIENLQLTPGEYQITISKQAYLTIIRKISIQAGTIIFLEPHLEPVVTDTQSHSPEPAATGKVATASETKKSKYEAPVALKKVTPSYPSAARIGRVTGTVTVVVEIDEGGRVRAAKATEGPVLLRRSAEDAAKQWRFSPALQDGVAVRSTQQVRFTYQP